jgi:hypothetical protein
MKKNLLMLLALGLFLAAAGACFTPSSKPAPKPAATVETPAR